MNDHGTVFHPPAGYSHMRPEWFRDESPGRWPQRLMCLLAGHRWRLLRTNLTKAVVLAHLHAMAGEDRRCDRCGREWLDFYGFGITPENESTCRRSVSGVLLPEPTKAVTP